MELILVRHGLPIRREVTDGPADPDLSIDGYKQAQLCAEYLNQEHIDAIYTSPMKRAFQTAQPLADLTNLIPIVDEGVAEFDQHSNEYIPVEELKAANDPRWKELVEGGYGLYEDPTEFNERVRLSFETIIENNKGSRVVVTCHGGVINSYLAFVLGLPEGKGQFFYPNYTSIHRIAASSSGHRSILSVNESGHLRNSGLPIGLFHG